MSAAGKAYGSALEDGYSIGQARAYSTLVGAAEGLLQNFLEPAFRSIIFGEAYDAPTINEMLETAVVTAGTTLLLGGGDTISNDLHENRQLNATIQTANIQANTAATQEEVAKSLMSKGVSSKKADGIAEAIAARLNGQELTRTQRERLSFELGSPTVQSVISEFIQKKSNGVDSPQNRMYDERNISDGLITEENAAGWNLPGVPHMNGRMRR